MKFKNSRNRILSADEEQALLLISKSRREDACIKAFGLFPFTARESIRRLIAKGMVERQDTELHLTAQGAALLADSPCVARKTICTVKMRSAGKAPVFAHNLSKRFYRKLNANLPMKGSPEWSDKWEMEVARLHKRDGYSIKEIADTLDFIVGDISDFGFCFAKNIRSLANIRQKWRNGMSKFATAYNAMIEKRTSKTTAETKQFVAEFSGKWETETRELYTNLLSLPHPDYSNERKRLGWKKCCAAMACFLQMFADERKWPAAIITAFGNMANNAATRIKIFNIGILMQLLKDFFKNYSGVTGYIRDENGGHYDDDYMSVVEEFMENAEKWQ